MHSKVPPGGVSVSSKVDGLYMDAVERQQIVICVAVNNDDSEILVSE